MVNYLLATFDVSDGIAVAAVLTSVGSLLGALKIAKRQRTFEFRFYQLRMLDPAKATLRRIVIDHDGRMNARQSSGRPSTVTVFGYRVISQ